MRLPFLQTLYAHMEWADALTWRTVLEDEAARSDDFTVESLVHLHMVQRAWLSIWRGEEVAMPTREDFGGLREIRDWGRAYHRDVSGFVEDLRDADLDEVIGVPWTKFIENEIGHPPMPGRLADAIYQVPAHSAHHRAQVSRRIREVGGSPEMIDYIGGANPAPTGRDEGVTPGAVSAPPRGPSVSRSAVQSTGSSSMSTIAVRDRSSENTWGSAPGRYST